MVNTKLVQTLGVVCPQLESSESNLCPYTPLLERDSAK
jgi:hypothetical protein